MRSTVLIIIDAANVVGSRPDGWWRDRAGAARRLIESVATGQAGSAEVVVVLEGAARAGVPAGDLDGVRVVHARHSGDDEIVDIVESEITKDSAGPVTVVTSDRELRARVAALGAATQGPRAFLSQL